MKTLCIYHGNCPDGFGAAWAVRHKLGGSVELIAGFHYEPPPEVAGQDVVMVDFAYKRPVMDVLLTQANSILVLDHHKTAAEDLSILLEQGKIGGIFDMSKSGAMLAWEWFHPNQPPPQLLLHIQDRDLWRYELEHTREIQAALTSYPYAFDVWDDLMNSDLSKLISDGIAIVRRQKRDIQELIDVSARRMAIAGYDVPALNTPPAWASDAGNILCQGEPFAACYGDHEGGRSYSLRSTNDGVDVSEIAVMFGGGGHRNAAGFNVSYEQDISVVPEETT